MSGTLSAEDLLEIRQTLALFPHAFDDKDDDALALVFAQDAVIELTRGGGSLKRGIEEIRAFARSLGDDAPDHHTLDTVVLVDEHGVVRARSRYLAVLSDQSVHNGEYLDTLVETPGGWRISHRISVPRYPRGEQVALAQDVRDAWHPRASR